MKAPYNDLGSLDDWLLKQAIEQAERGISIEDELIPGTVERLGLPYVYLYAACWFPRGTEPVFPPRSEPPLSMVF